MVVNGPPVASGRTPPSLAPPGLRTDARMTIDLDEGAERDELALLTRRFWTQVLFDDSSISQWYFVAELREGESVGMSS